MIEMKRGFCRFNAKLREKKTLFAVSDGLLTSICASKISQVLGFFVQFRSILAGNRSVRA